MKPLKTLLAYLATFLLLAHHSDVVRTLTILPNYQPPADRALAADWLGKLQAKEAVPTLLTLCNDPDGSVRSAAITALGRLGDKRAVATLRKLAEESPETVKGATAYVVDDKVALVGPMGREGLYAVRDAARQALGQVSPTPSQEPTTIFQRRVGQRVPRLEKVHAQHQLRA